MNVKIVLNYRQKGVVTKNKYKKSKNILVFCFTKGVLKICHYFVKWILSQIIIFEISKITLVP